MDDEPDGPTRSLGDFVRRVPLSWWLPLPGALAHALVLLFSGRVWTTLIETSSRSGRSGTAIDAHRYLMFLAIALGGYVAFGVAGDWIWNGGRGMRTPTDGETSVARVVMRGLCLVALYLSAFSLVRSYVFN